MSTLAEKIAAHAKNAPMPGTTARPPVEGMPVHIDGDYLCYYCAGNDETSPGEARQRAIDRIKRAMEVSGATRAIIHMSTVDCNKGYRFLVTDGAKHSKPYQGQRDKGRKPQNWQVLRDWIDDYSGDLFTVVQWRDREADDGMAWAAEQSFKLERPGAVLTADKDMRMFAGLHIVWKTFEMVMVDPGCYDKFCGGLQYGHKWFWQQMVMGDTADFILGLPGAGKVAAEKTLAGTTNNLEAYHKVLDLYKSKLGDDYADHFVEQAVLLWMRTDAKAFVLDFRNLLPRHEWGTDIDRAMGRILKRVMDHPSYGL